MKSFNVIVWEPNIKKFIPYNIIPYLIDAYDERVLNHKKYPNNKYWNVPKTFDEFRDFVKSESQYQFWGRCEYEIILEDWPCLKTEEKIDVHWQIMMNINLITEIIIEIINGRERN